MRTASGVPARQPPERDAGRAVGNVDRAAAREAERRQRVQHGRVVRVRINMQMRAPRRAPRNAGAQRAVHAPRAGNAVNRAMRRAGQPSALPNPSVTYPRNRAREVRSIRKKSYHSNWSEWNYRVSQN